MKVKCVSREYPVSLLHGKEYEVLAIESGLYRIVDEDGLDDDDDCPGYLYSPELFETVED